MQEINRNILNYLTSFSNNNFLEKNIWIMADLPIFFIPIFLLWMWLYYSFTKTIENNIFNKDKKKEVLLFIFYSTIIALIISLIIQQFVNIERPENYINKTWKLLMKHLPDASFPSDHATVSFAFLSALFFANYKKIWLIFLPFVLIMNISRVIAWIHWPFDVIAGMLVWIFSSFIIFEYFKKIESIKKINKYILEVMKIFKL